MTMAQSYNPPSSYHMTSSLRQREPPPAPIAERENKRAPSYPLQPSRDSTWESAGQAADIFDLYGSPDGDRGRDSESLSLSRASLDHSPRKVVKVVPHRGRSMSPSTDFGRVESVMDRDLGAGESSNGRAGDRPGIAITSPPSPSPPTAPLECQDSNPQTPIKPRQSSVAQPRPESQSGSLYRTSQCGGLGPGGTIRGRSGDSMSPSGSFSGLGLGASEKLVGSRDGAGEIIGRCSTSSENTPGIAITCPPSPISPDRPQQSSHDSKPHTPVKSRHASMISTRSDSTSNSPYRSSIIGGLSPGGTVAGRSSMSTSCSGVGTSEENRSQTSVAGSSRYPGEDEDAFHVRSTYWRLDSEGVHGDGWDQGIERTRGGPPNESSKRATVFSAAKTGDLAEQERQFLSSLDRYGFVNEPHRNRSESRLALIPSSALLKIPKIPNRSPLAGKPAAEPNNTFNPSDNGPCPQTPKSPRPDVAEEERGRKKEAERVGKWGKMMKVRSRDHGGNILDWDWGKEQEAKVSKRVYKGIPDRWRMAAWWTLSEEQVHKWKGKGKGKASASEIGAEYQTTINLPSSFDVQIDLDVPRTISGHTMFVTRYGAGQRNLWHVLHCFSQLCPACGYVQGMGPIAATLLCYFDPERAYSLLVRLHDVYGMHEIFEPGFPGLLEAFYVQERLMEWMMPDVYQSFQRNMISSSAWGTKWYITLFVNTVPFSQQLRVWDVLWLEGRDTIIVTSLAILWSFRNLLSSPSATFESILSLLSSYFVAEDENALLNWIRKVLGQKGLKEKMDGWRREWEALVKEGKSDAALL